MTTANDILFGSGVPKVSLGEGEYVVGRITRISEPYQEREWKKDNTPGDPKTFPSGDPIMGFDVDLATDLRDPNIEGDDGVRRLYVNGKRIKDALRDAIKASGARGLAIGSSVQIICTHFDTPGDVRSGRNFQVTYTPGQAANNVLMGQQPAAPQSAPQALAQPPATHQAYAPTPQAQPIQQQYAQQPAPQYAAAAAAPMPPQQYAAPAPQAPADPSAPDPVQLAAVIAAGADPRAVFAGQFPAWAASYQPQG